MAKALVIYFSAGGHTKVKALQLSEAIEADIFEIEPVKKYTKADLLWMNPLSRSFREVAYGFIKPLKAEFAVTRLKL